MARSNGRGSSGPARTIPVHSESRMTETNCLRELDLEIPAEEVQKATERIAREFARIARVPGFRPGKAPVTLIRRRFAEDIKAELLQSLVPEHIEKAVSEQKLMPVTRPQVDKVDLTEGGPLKFRATFEVLPEFELGNYKDLEVEVEALEITDADVEKGLNELRERGATFVPAEGRAIQNGDYAQIKLMGTPIGGGEPLQAESVLCHVGAEETIEAFNENLRGAKAGEHRRFEVHYPADYPDQKLTGKAYTYAVEILAVKEKKLPELDDEFAKQVSDAKTMDELRAKMRQNMEAARDERQAEQARDRILAKLIAANEFPVPEALVDHQMDVRLERAARTLVAQGVDPRARPSDARRALPERGTRVPQSAWRGCGRAPARLGARRARPPCSGASSRAARPSFSRRSPAWRIR